MDFWDTCDICYWLFAVCWFIFATCFLIFATWYLLIDTCCLLVARRWLIIAVCYLLFALCLLPFAICWLHQEELRIVIFFDWYITSRRKSYGVWGVWGAFLWRKWGVLGMSCVLLVPTLTIVGSSHRLFKSPRISCFDRALPQGFWHDLIKFKKATAVRLIGYLIYTHKTTVRVIRNFREGEGSAGKSE